MINTIKILIMFLALALLVFLPKASYAAWDDQHGRDEGRAHHGHGFHYHANPDLTLVTGMDNIDTRVLMAGPDQMPEVVDQPVPEVAATTPSPVISPDTDGNFIVDVPNNAGGYTPVRIQKSGSGYVGPQGELYYPFPEVSQLKAMYGI